MIYIERVWSLSGLDIKGLWYLVCYCTSLALFAFILQQSILVSVVLSALFLSLLRASLHSRHVRNHKMLKRWILIRWNAGANTYIAIIGSRERASFRINAAQAFNGLASTIAPIVASYAFFGGTEDSGSKNLDSVKWTYIGVACG